MSQIITNGQGGFFSNLGMGKGAAVVDAGTDLDLFLSLAGADYTVTPVQAMHPITGDPVPGQFFLDRQPGNVVVAPKTVTANYGVITPSDMAESVRDLVDQGWLTPSDFMLQKKEGIVGMREVLAFRLDAQRKIGDEEDWSFFLLLGNVHGRGKVTGCIVSNRPRCENQIVGILSSFNWSVSHRVPKADQTVVRARVNDAAQSWQVLNNKIDAMARKLGLFVDFPMDWNLALEATNDVLGIPQNADEKEISGQKRNNRDAILAEFNNPTRGTFGKSAFDLYMAATAFLTHGDSTGRIKSKMPPEGRASGRLSGGLARLEAGMVDTLSAMVAA